MYTYNNERIETIFHQADSTLHKNSHLV